MEHSYMIRGRAGNKSYMRIVLDEHDMYTFQRRFNICDYDNVCVTCYRLPTSTLPPCIETVLRQFKDKAGRRSLPSLRIGFSVGNEYRRRKLDHLHDLMQFKYDDETDALCTVENESRRGWRDRSPQFTGSIDGTPFKFMRMHDWYASYFTLDDQQTCDSFFTDPVWDYNSDDEWEHVNV